MEKYEKSQLRQLHQALDNEPGDPPNLWGKTYRNYDAITSDIPEIADILAQANPKLLEPVALDFVLNRLFERWGGENSISVAGHVRTFLRSVYEYHMFNWGNRFCRHYVAEQEATGWTAIILGQRFDKR